MKKNPIEISEEIKEEFSTYLSSTYYVNTDETIREQMENELNSVNLFKGPFLHTTLPFETGDNIQGLIRKGILNPGFEKLGNINLMRPLYKHQEESIRQGADGNNLIVTTGTGSGKTESFLFPILNYIMNLNSKGDKKPGIKAIFLYPLNALVNDQMDRLRVLLRNFPEIKFGSYTGETPENDEKLEKSGVNKSDYPENELLTREKMRKEPPDILFTNYAMLEYLLIRPGDNFITKEEFREQFRFFVIDEAHTYSGTNGIEISYLIKRFIGFANQSKPQFILTSATLGTSAEADKIADFGHRLTSGSFKKENIIFAQRKPLTPEKGILKLPYQLYSELSKNLEDPKKFFDIAVKYYPGLGYSETVEKMLYDLLIADRNTYSLFDSIDNIKEFSRVFEDLSGEIDSDMSPDNLASQIQLISLANNGTSGLYDIKFHLFVSVPNRAFMTLTKDRTIRFGNYPEIEGNKAFEIGMCRNCGKLYLIGDISNGFLEPDETVDLYENYEDSTSVNLDFFLLEDPQDEEHTEMMELCPHCGMIYPINQVNKKWCEHSNKDRILVYRVTNNDRKTKTQTHNNLTYCPSCEHTNNRGIVRSFKINKDLAATTLTHVYYDSINEAKTYDPESETFESDGGLDLSFDLLSAPKKSTKKKESGMQLLTFSDSRQQASFSSVTFEADHEKYLKRSLIWHEIKDTSSTSVQKLHGALESSMRVKRLYENTGRYSEKEQDLSTEAWKAILYDLFSIDVRENAEAVGLYYYKYSDIEDKLERNRNKLEPQVKRMFGLYYEDFIQLLHILINRFRINGAIDFDSLQLSTEDTNDIFEFGDPQHYYVKKKSDTDKENKKNEPPYMKRVMSFLPVKENGENYFTDFFHKLYPKKSKEEIATIMSGVFSFLAGNFLKETELPEMNVYRLEPKKFNVIPWNYGQFYICDKCKRVTPFNVDGICPTYHCKGHLSPCNPEEIFAKNFFRNHYMKAKFENILIKEHTAQLDKKTAKAYQNGFKDKDINILSSSTTFEMGVDLGTLENVLLRNVPPTPANYVQRAGRAGRSKDAAALIVTYCGNSSHDFHYFSEPETMINGSILPPQFKAENEKVILRHLLAASFGWYFRSHREYYDNYHQFLYEERMKPFIDYLKSEPKDLGRYIDDKILCEPSLEFLRQNKWAEKVLEETGLLNSFISLICDKKENFENLINKATEEQDFKKAFELNKQKDALLNKKLVSLLSEYAIIPKYGFPIDVVNLDVDSTSPFEIKMDGLNLSRDLKIALTEYAPDSEVVADGNKYTSRYINSFQSNPLEKQFYKQCSNCGHIELSDGTGNFTERCPECGSKLSGFTESFLIPRLGFKADQKRKAPSSRPVKSKSSDVFYIGDGANEEQVLELPNIKLHLATDERLLALNPNRFYTCPRCGYSKKMGRNVKSKAEHTDRNGRKCSNEKLELTSLGYIFVTDVLRIQFSKPYDYSELVSLCNALIVGMSNELQIERKDVDGIVISPKNHAASEKNQILLFDNVPGGAGYVRSLADRNTLTKVIEAAYAAVNRDCCSEESSCYNCLRTFYNQKDHKELKRGLAKELLNEMITKELNDKISDQEE